MFLLAGNAQARGVYLDGYGIFFDVAVPMLRQSMMWSLRMMLQQDDTGTKQAIAEIRRHIQTETDARQRQILESAMARLEAQATPFAKVEPADARAVAWRPGRRVLHLDVPTGRRGASPAGPIRPRQRGRISRG